MQKQNVKMWVWDLMNIADGKTRLRLVEMEYEKTTNMKQHGNSSTHIAFIMDVPSRKYEVSMKNAI